MRQLILTAIFLFTPLLAFGQCGSESQCVPNAVIDRATAAVTELAAARDTIEAFKRERGATDAERAAAARLIDRLNGVIATQDKLAVEYDKVIALYKALIAEQAALIDRQSKMLSKGKSGFEKFTSLLKTVGAILAGVTLGRGL